MFNIGLFISSFRHLSDSGSTKVQQRSGNAEATSFYLGVRRVWVARARS